MRRTRRDFLRTAGTLTAASAMIGAPIEAYAQAAPAPQSAPPPPAVPALGKMTVHTLPPLPYDYNALEPYIDEATMRLHHDKHHAAYVNGLIAAETKLAEARASGDYEYVEYWSKKAAFNGGGHWLHSMFWKVMAPPGNGGGGEPQGMLAEKLANDFGSVAAFRAHFAAAAKAAEGAGWALLHYRFTDGRLVILQAENQQKITSWNTVPFLGIDVWEHAYYLKYNNRRADYVDAWWNVVNWGQVETNLTALMGAMKA